MTATTTDTPISVNAKPSNRGKLRNGNPTGDYLSAPRRGAKTRAGGGCAQPATKNGRCRFHGGKSTGARTAEGREDNRSFRQLLTELPRRPRGRPAGTRRPAGHGVLPSSWRFTSTALARLFGRTAR